MKIIINGRFLTQKVTGVQRVAVEYIKSIDFLLEKIEEDIQFIIFVPNENYYKIELNNIKIKVVKGLKGHLWEQITLPLVSKNNCIINFCNTSPLMKRKQITFIHDAAIFRESAAYSKKFVLWYKLLYKCAAYFSKRIVTVSEFSKGELISFLPRIEKKIEVIYNGVDHFNTIQPDEKILTSHNIQKKSYYLCVGSVHPNKNFELLTSSLSAFNEEYQLVIAGGNNIRVFKELQTHEYDNVKRVGYVTDEELKALYINARAFIFPSIYEGFGLPPLEAMSVGCPVIASNAASIPEICGNGAIYFNPNDKQDFIDKLKTIDDDKLMDLSNNGKLRSENFKWVNSASKLIELGKKVYM